MNIAIIGCGYVGLTTGACFAELGHTVRAVDIDQDRVKKLNDGKSPIFEPGLEELIVKNLNTKIYFSTDLKGSIEPSEIIFICVDTPSKHSGQADLRYVEKVARDLSQYINEYKVIVDKSTVPLKTAEKVKDTIMRYNNRFIEFDIVSNPEFLREGSAVKDTMYPDRIVIGSDSKKAKKIMLECFKPVIDQSKAPVKMVSVRSAELIKHGANTFLATKISFANMIAEVCENSSADAKEVLEAIGLDERIGKQFLHHGIGFGGSCFPKDISAFKKTLEVLGVDNTLIKAVENINENAWRRFLQKIERELWVLDGKTIGVLGLSFKPNTDDIRNAPAHKIIKALMEEGAKIKAYDPQAMQRTQKVFPHITYCENALDTAKDCDALVICTEWQEFKTIDLKRLKELMLTPVIFDGRNTLDEKKVAEYGFKYFGVGK